jgi:hypothetical protein
MNAKRGFFSIIVLTITILSCTRMAPETITDDGQNNNCTPQFPDKQVTYNNYVKNIITTHCTVTCHRGGNTLGTGNFTTYSGILPHTGSIFYFRVIQDNADMPQGMAPLPKAIRDSLNIWIANCSPEN